VALADMQLNAADVLMVGDDIDSDVAGAQQAGIMAGLVKTGKYREAYYRASTIRPDLILDTVADLPGLLGLADRQLILD
jgi:ribonucleotide monophosphatase NagD (HAD superfamily)